MSNNYSLNADAGGDSPKIESIYDCRGTIIKYLSDGYEQLDEFGGWGRNRGGGISITNTCEALLITYHLGFMHDEFLLQRSDSIKKYVRTQLFQKLERNECTTRDLAFGALGLYLLNESNEEDLLINTAIEKLLSISNPNGGWSHDANTEVVSLVHTFNAMNVLQRMERADQIEDVHYEWLASLQGPDDMCAFAPRSSKTFFGASSLAFYLISHFEGMDKYAWVKRLKAKLVIELNNRISAESGFTEYCIDSNSNFRVYGYGHALMGLEHCDEDFCELNIDGFLSDAASYYYRIPDGTWVPEVLEYAMAIDAISRRFDPFFLNKYLESIRTDQLLEKDAYEDLQKKAADIKSQETLLAVEKREIARQRSSLPDEIIDAINTKLKAYFWEKAKSLLGKIISMLIIIGTITALIVKHTSEEGLSFWDFWILFLAAIPVYLLSIQIKQHFETNKNKKEIEETILDDQEAS